MIKLFVVGFPKEMDEPELHTFFSDFGDVVAVKIITEQDTGMSKGYAFVDFMDEVGARLAIKELDGSSFEDRTLNVRLADKQPRPRTSSDKPVAERQYEKVRQVKSKRPRRKSWQHLLGVPNIFISVEIPPKLGLISAPMTTLPV